MTLRTAPSNSHPPRRRGAGPAMLFALVAMTVLHTGCATARLAPYAHAPVTGALGPFPKALVELRYADPANANGFTGTVQVPATHALPNPDEPTDFFDVKVRAVMFADADRKPGNELLVLYSAQKTGPATPLYYAVTVYKWAGADFVRLRDVEAKLEGSHNAADVRRRLAGKRAA
ncbi:MAG: hypothetical protein H7267_08205 [Sandarakinorhabdus sp.]|nr:hypothetical protein [Sandarakinorhabdus sp.]